MGPLPHHLERTIVIRAARETVFSFFTDSARWASWWGAGSRIDPRPSGAVLIRYPNGVEATGEVVDVAPPASIIFTVGFVSGTPIGPGESRVTIALTPHADGTTLRLQHAFAEAAVRDAHVQGWRFQLALFANAVADLAYADAPAVVDRWFACWREKDETARTTALAAIARPDVTFSDRFSLVAGIADLVPHVTASQRFQPGLEISRTGDVRQCQGTVLADWQAIGPDGTPRARGTNVFVLDTDGAIRSVMGFWRQ